MSSKPINSSQLFEALSEEELDELDRFLMSDAVSDETMVLDSLDGYLTAIIIGPTTFEFDEWFPFIWGPSEEHIPQFPSKEEAQYIVDMIIRHFNSIVDVLERDPDAASPLITVVEDPDEGVTLDGELWAYGFMVGVDLCKEDWNPLIQDSEGAQAFLPIFLLGSDEISDDYTELVDALEKSAELAEFIPDSIAWIYRFWQPHRLEQMLATTVRREHAKIGRNDQCPCGSGKKFKYCCISGVILH